MGWRFLLIGCVLCAACPDPSGASSLREMNRKIKAQKKDLEKLHAQIETLEGERDRLKHDEEALSKTLKKIEGGLEQSTRKQVKLNRQIRDTAARTRRAEKEVALLTGERSQWETSIVDDLRGYYAQVEFPRRLETRPLEEQALRSMIALKCSNMKSAETRKDQAARRQTKLLQDKRTLTALNGKLQDEIQKQKDSQEEKQRLYQTTMGKRVIAEQEAQRLRDTAESLEQMISQLIKKKNKTLAEQQEAAAARKSMDERRGNLPWPVQGAVVSAFGRQKRADLNITVINNGIKIRTQAASPVKAVGPGTVVYASDFRSYGQTVILDHGGDSYSIYGLLGSILVKDGEKVPSGKAVGTAAAEKGAQIYFEFRDQGRPDNPLLWLRQQ